MPTSTDSPRCTVCKDLDTVFAIEYPLDFVFTRVPVDLLVLKDSAFTCSLCSTVYGGIVEFMQTKSKGVGQASLDNEITVGLSSRKSYGTLNAHVVVRNRATQPKSVGGKGIQSSGIIDMPLEIYTPEDCEPAWEAFGKAHHLLRSTREYFLRGGMVHDWLRDCIANHASCSPDEPPHLPTRVIDVTGNERSNGWPFLYESHGEVADYICLSYCWGDNPLGSFTTTSSTLARRKECIRKTELPPLFVDVIWIAKALRIQYVWIDSIYIIQDDAEDWARESAAMCDVYGRSFLTIAALEAPDPSSGMFYDLDDSGGELGTVEVNAAQSDGLRSVVNVRRRLPQRMGELDLPLRQRAWTFQESLLPRRVVELGRYEPRWRCNTMSTCCCTVKPQTDDIFMGKYFIGSKATSAMSGRERWALWWSVVSEYTSRRLTRGTDKLVALSGIAKALGHFWEGRYLAGVWEEELLMGLWWRLDGISSRRPRPTPYRAPSWSWASIDSRVWAPSPSFYKASFFQVTILDVHCELATDDPTGALRGGHLTLTGKLIPAEFMYGSHCQTFAFGGKTLLDSLYIGPDRLTVQVDVAMPSVTTEGVPALRPVYCLLLGMGGDLAPESSLTDSGIAKQRLEYSIMVLRRSAHGGDAFERIGTYGNFGDEPERWFEGVEDTTLTIV